MPTTFLFVVFGCTGRYEDFRQWAVGGSADKARADAFAEEMNDWCETNGIAFDRCNVRRPWDVVSPHDPDFQCDDTGVRYDVRTVRQLDGHNGFVTAPLTHRMKLRAA